MTGQATYEIRVEGHLDDHWSDRLGGAAVAHNADGTTTLTGRFADQAQLYGVLTALRDIGATLLSVAGDRGTRSLAGRAGAAHGGRMKAEVGDSLVAESNRVDAVPRRGEIVEVRGEDGGPPYVVKWSDGHEGLVYPGADAHVVAVQG